MYGIHPQYIAGLSALLSSLSPQEAVREESRSGGKSFLTSFEISLGMLKTSADRLLFAS